MTETRQIKRFGWIPDLPDNRDKTYLSSGFRTLPSVVDLREFCSPIENQGELGSCTANAIVGALEFIGIKAGDELTNLSRLFVYYNERVYIHTVKEDSGAMIRDGIKSLVKKGVCTEDSWNYDISKFTVKPSLTAYKEAADHKIALYQRLNGLRQMRACLATGYPFVFGFTVYDSFGSKKVSDTGIVPMPTKEERVRGGHAVLAVGYDDNEHMFLVKNSWGEDWGIKGYFKMPYEYLDDRNLSDDMWMISV